VRALEPKFKKGKLKGKVAMQEYLAVEGNNLIMPAVGVDANGRGYLVFTLVGPDHFPSAAVSRISLGHPAPAVNVVAAGLGPQDGFSGYWIGGPRPRWGDYFYSAVDEQGNVWLAVHRADLHLHRVDHRGPHLREHPWGVRQLRHAGDGVEVASRLLSRSGDPGDALGSIRGVPKRGAGGVLVRGVVRAC